MATSFLSLFHKTAPQPADSDAGGRPLNRRIEAGDFAIDVQHRRVTVRGNEISLTEAEFELLLFLCRHRRKVVTPRTLLISRWAQREARQQDFLPVLLSLRKKLDSEIPGQHYIRMEPWMLCRFEPSNS